MHRGLRFVPVLAVLAMLSIGFAQAARAAAPAPPAAPYVVTYIEVAHGAADEVKALLKAYAEACAKEAGTLFCRALQRIGHPHHFAIVGGWKDEKARLAHAASARAKELLAKLRQHLISAYDERPHLQLAAGPAMKAIPDGAVFAVTHVDIVPTFKEKGWNMVKELAAMSRKEGGSAHFDGLQQASRLNHMTLVEAWKDKAAQEAHAMSAHMKKFRHDLLPISGSLYDERLYTAIP